MNKFVIVELQNIPNLELSRRLENYKITKNTFNKDLLDYEPINLNDLQIKKLIRYYSKINLSELSTKDEKIIVDKIDALKFELQRR